MRGGCLTLVLSLLPALLGAQGYQIGPEDVLHVVVLGQADMTGDFPVDRAGDLTLPVLGKVRAAGSSPAAFEHELTRQLADGFLKRPQVSVTVKEYRSQRVYVTGEVQHPGVYPLKAERSLRALLGEVGALTANAGHEVLVIRPPGEGETRPPGAEAAEPGAGTEVARVGLRDLLAGAASDVELRSGDTVQVPAAAQVYVTGFVARQGSLRFREDLTVLQALTLAGGVTERGSTKRIKILRTKDGRLVELKAALSDPLQPGDTLVVPERYF